MLRTVLEITFFAVISAIAAKFFGANFHDCFELSILGSIVAKLNKQEKL